MEYVAAILILAGALLTLLAGIGLLRFKDLLSRMHAATKPATLGLMLILTGVAVALPSPEPIAKLVLVILLQFITAPVGAHLLGRSVFTTGEPLRPETLVDEESARRREGGVDPDG